MTIRFKITHVDMNGYWGRENHPQESDNGLVVTPVSMETAVFDDEGDQICNADETTVALAANNMTIDGMARSTQAHNILQMWTCVTEDGRYLCLMDHEIELWTAGDPNNGALLDRR